MFRNLIPIFVLKSVTTGDDMYVDDAGKHIIFRNIHGKVVPIHTDAEGYADWLEKQGVPINTSDQKTLRALESELEILSRAAEVGGPSLQHTYEKAFEKQREQYTGLVQQYYQQALQKQATEQNTTPEKVHKQKKAVYEQHKDEVQKRTSMPDRGWGSYVESYVNQLIDTAKAKPDEMLWYTLKAFDLALVKAMDMAKEGISPAQLNLDDLVREELESGSGMREHYESRYKPYASETKNEYTVLANLYPGLENLEDNLKSNSQGASALRDHFDEIYRRMYDDFNPQEQETFTPINPSIFEGAGATLPKDLPEKFSVSEASALMSVFDNFRGSKLNASHRVVLHSASRIFDSINAKDQITATVAITDPKTGLHALHKLEYKNAYDRYYQYGQDVDMGTAIEEILRITTKASESTSTSDKVHALKELSQRLGRLDGTILLRKSDKRLSQESFMKRWVNSSLNAGLAKGDGPDLIKTLTDEDARNASMYTNQALKIRHPGVIEPIKKVDDLDELPKIEETEEITEGKKAIHAGFHVSGNKIIAEDGFIITPTENTWQIKSPSGANVGSIKLHPQKEIDPEAREKYKTYVFGAAQRLIDTYKQRDPEVPEEVKNDLEEDIRVPVFQFTDKLSKKQQTELTGVTDAVSKNNIEVSTKIPGKVFRLKNGNDTVDLLYNPKKKSLMLGYRDSRGNLSFDTDIQATNILSKLNIAEESKPEIKKEVKEVKKKEVKKEEKKKEVKKPEQKPTPEPKQKTTPEPEKELKDLKVGDIKTIERRSSFGTLQRVKIKILPDGKAEVLSWEKKKKGEEDFTPSPKELGKVSDVSSFFPTKKSIGNFIRNLNL